MKKKSPANKLRWIALPVYAVCGFLIGIVNVRYGLDEICGGLPGLLLLLGLIYLSFFLQIILHEGGHLVCGLLTGYRFSLFRIGSLVLVKRPEGLKLKRMNLPGTGGQCLLAPPEWTDEGIPFVLYNLGGILANLLSLPVCWGLSLLCADLPILRILLIILSINGPAMALLNAIPLTGGMVNNDGRNTLEMLRDRSAVRALWTQLQISVCEIRGVRLKDMSEEWFRLPEGADLDNSQVFSVAISAMERLMDQMRFDQAEEEIRSLLEHSDRTIGYYRCILRGELLFCMLLRGAEREELVPLLDKEQLAFMKKMGRSCFVLRTEYALALLRDRDEKKAAEKLAAFQKAAANDLYAASVESERSLIAEVQAAFERQKNERWYSPL